MSTGIVSTALLHSVLYICYVCGPVGESVLHESWGQGGRGQGR